MSDLLILGPQRRAPDLSSRLAAAGMTGRIAAITAGWQEREAELAALEEHLGQPVQDLRLYTRAEAVFAEDLEYHEAYRARQSALRETQDLYRLQLEHAKAAACELYRAQRPTPALRRARAAAVSALRRLDARHLASIDALHRRFEQQWRSAERPSIARHLTDLKRSVDAASMVLIAGGHVAVLVNRLRLFGMRTLLGSRPIAAWSAGAMALTTRVLLFHDRPPQGAGTAEVFEHGLGLVPGAVFLPHAATRLAIDDRERTALLARRLRPACCYTLDDGDWLLFRDGVLQAGVGSRRLSRAGSPVSMEMRA
jgi:Peptidase family S51